MRRDFTFQKTVILRGVIFEVIAILLDGGMLRGCLGRLISAFNRSCCFICSWRRAEETPTVTPGDVREHEKNHAARIPVSEIVNRAASSPRIGHCQLDDLLIAALVTGRTG